MAATVQVNEYNGSSGTITANITNSNMGSVDAANLVPADYPIAAGTYSFEKWQRITVTDMGGSSKISSFKVWRTGALSGDDTHKTNAATNDYTATTTYTQPVNTQSTKATNTMPTSEPPSANIGIGGSLTGELTSAGSSDFFIHQIYVDENTTTGASTTINIKYTEVS